jgi:hypothetical protein
MSQEAPGPAGGGLSDREEPSASGRDSGTYEADADPDHVWVKRDANGETIRARFRGYPVDFAFEAGDATGIELVDGEWHTIPSVFHTVRLGSRIEWWTMNRRTGFFRLLSERTLD